MCIVSMTIATYFKMVSAHLVPFIWLKYFKVSVIYSSLASFTESSVVIKIFKYPDVYGLSKLNLIRNHIYIYNYVHC